MLKPSQHLYIEPLSLGLPKRMPVPEVATISSAAYVVPGIMNSNGRYTRGRMRGARGDGHYPDFNKR
jgi:hypothetical protein